MSDSTDSDNDNDNNNNNSNNSNDNSGYVLSIDDNDLVVYKGDDKYVCKNCIDPKTKKTKRLLCAIKKRANLSIKIVDVKDNDNESDSIHRVDLSVVHPLYDPDLYIMYDKNIANVMYESANIIDNVNLDKVNSNNDTSKNKDKKPLCYIYVLFLEQDKYYVGKSLKPMSRTGSHMASTLFDDKICSGGGSGWTRMYSPIKILEVTPSYDEFDEDKYTLRYMKDKGIDNVRGGSFCELNLPQAIVTTLEKMLAGASDKCYYCGASGHFINACPQKNLKRVAQKQKKTVVKSKDIPKSKILKYYGTTQLLKNSNLNNNNNQNNNNNNDFEDNDNNNVESNKDVEKVETSFKCRYCNKNFSTSHNRNNHENLLCTKSLKVIQGKSIEANVDALLEKNKRYIKPKK